ncbi:MAG: FecR domain-containing protein [Pseudomonadota bacterium]
MGSALFAQDARLRAPLERIAIGPDQTLRSFVATHLNDPDLWPYVLQLNKIASPADVAPGQVFELPVQQVAAADDALSRSLEAIQKANAEGAQVFAPTQIGNAIDSRESAITERETGSFAASVDLSDIAVVLAAEALEIAIAQRDRSAEAVVSDVHGAVEGRAPKDSRWSDRGLNDILVEFERVRTLSDSTTQITFRDLSRLRLNANSNATIQRMRSDPLTGGEVTKVSLVNGDFYALLNQLSGKTSFEVDVPGVETTTNSGDFWIKNDQTGARFVNYDTPALEVVADGATTLVRENEGVVLTSAGTQRTQVLDAPRLALPAEGAIIYTATAQLGWDEFEGARAYWVEVASDPGFNDMRVSEWGIEGTAFETPDLPPRVYHWRVAALDELGLPGQWSKAQPFTVRVDTTPPFLALLSPEPNLLSDQPQVEVFGASEPDATVLLNGAPVTLGTDGSFIEVVTLTPGQNLIRLEAVDPAGNTSNAAQAVVYRPKVAVTITLAPTLPRVGTALATRSAEMTVTAASSAAPGARVEVRGAGGVLAAETVVGPAGDISFTLPASAAETTYEITVLSPTGAVEGRAPVSVLRDQTPPVLTLDAPLPPATDVDTVDVSGDAGDAVALTLGGQDVPLTGGRFEATVTLEPGQNGFDLIASDAVGNVAATRLSTLYDIDPPEILRTDLSRPSGSSGPIVIEAEATDASGLRQAASYLIEVSGVEREGWLRCDNATGLCTATLPPEPGDLRLIEIVIEDYAGNAAFN